MSTEVVELDESETQALVVATLADLELSAEELKAQAKCGVFDSEHARRAWFALEGLL